MQITEQLDLAEHSTMRLGGSARYACTVHNREDVVVAINWAASHAVRPLMIGSGSNIIWHDQGFDGLLILNDIHGYQQINRPDGAEIVIGAGEIWDEVVARSVAAGLSGIEALSLIPGTAGATPVQNVGAYGQDISQTLISLEAYDTLNHTFVTIPAADCEFSYRASRFNRADRGRFCIVSLRLGLRTAPPQPPFYAAVEQYLTQRGITTYTPAAIRKAVIAIRSAKLPDPAVIANCGSFFGNPIIPADQAAALQTRFPELPQLPGNAAGTVKLPAAWLIERAGFKDYHDAATGMATWPTQPLVLVNEHARRTADVLAFKQKIVDAVAAEFGISLQQEPELLP